MKKKVLRVEIECNFSGANNNVSFYLGNPKDDAHPIFYQSKFIREERGGTVPTEFMDGLSKIQELSIKHGIPFVELCKYSLESLNIIKEES